MDDIQNALTTIAVFIQFLMLAIAIYGLLKNLFFRPRIQYSVILEAVDFLTALPPKDECKDTANTVALS